MHKDALMIKKLLRKRISRIFCPDRLESYKILIIDEKTRDILSVLFNISDFRSLGICAHYMVGSKNPKLPDIPSIYYVYAFEEAISDISQDRYSSYYLSSSFQINRRDLENLAVKLGENGAAGKIEKVQDTFTHFIPLQEDIFTLNIQNSFAKFDYENILNGLFSFLVTINMNPAIVCSPQLDVLSHSSSILDGLTKKLKSTKLIKTQIKRPLLILVDRELDLITPCMHVMGYLEILEDLFGMPLNKVEIKEKAVNIDTETDFFRKNRFEDFTNVIQVVEDEVASYKKELLVRNMSNNEDLAKILDATPELQRQNEIITSHLRLCTEAVEIIKDRKLDDYFAMENSFDKNAISDLTDAGNDRDIIRFVLSMIGTKNEDLIAPILEKRKIETNIVDFVKKMQIQEKNTLLKKGLHFFFNRKIPAVDYVDDVISKLKNNSLKDFYYSNDTEESVYWSEISQVVVFFVGGVSYFEFKKLKELESKYDLPFIVGGSEVLSGECLLKQIEKLSLETYQ